MNNKEIAAFRRSIKPENARLKIFDFLAVYVTKDSDEIYHVEGHPFPMVEREQQELYLGNFKKLLAGRLDVKLFPLAFRKETGVDHAQQILYQGLIANHAAEWQEAMLRMVAKMLQYGPFSEDKVITFIRGQYTQPVRKRDEEAEPGEGLEAYVLPFILCTINQTELPPKTLVFDYVAREFKYQVSVDPVVKLTAPETGFLFPCWTDGAADVNHVLYAAGKANEPDSVFMEEVLNAERRATAREEREVFGEIVREVAGEQLDAATIAQVYEAINQFIEERKEEDEPPLMDCRDVERVLAQSGVEGAGPEKVEQAFRLVTDQVNYELKADNLIPSFTSKSVKIDTKVATITISPQDLKYVRQVEMQGKKYLLIELEEDAVIDGFILRSEPLR